MFRFFMNCEPCPGENYTQKVSNWPRPSKKLSEHNLKTCLSKNIKIKLGNKNGYFFEIFKSLIMTF
jgi:hypothetical protein